MASRLSKTTTDHEEIRRWAEERGGKPAEVIGTERGGGTGMIRLDFPGYTGEGSLRPISWDEWFQKFDEAGLALTYQEQTAGGERSNFNKLIGRETARARAAGDNKASRRSARRAGRSEEGRARRGGTSRAAGRRSAGRGRGQSSAMAPE